MSLRHFWSLLVHRLILAVVSVWVQSTRLFSIVHFTTQIEKAAVSTSASPVTPATEIIPRKCPQCGAELKPDVSEGLCPACLLQRGIATEGGVPPGTPPFVPPTIPDLAKLFPQLEIIELIGQGGMGAVYKARQPALDRFVALKILAPRSGGDLDFANRFTREARALAKLSHPNIVGVYDFGRAELPLGQDAQQRVPTTPIHYFIMEYVDGPNLRQVEQAGKLPPREALEIIPQICDALQFAHDEGIVHRDIKPENILLDKKGRVKIADFGLAKILGQEPKDLRLTGARDIMGTPHYMAPEQMEKPQEVDHRADIYSLGVVFYEMLTGELPLGKFQPPSQKVQVDVRLDEVVLRSLAREPELRYQNVSEVKTRVETISSTNAPATAPAVPASELLARDYALNIRSCLRRGWALVRKDFWPLVGMSAFVLVMMSAAASFEVVLSSGKSAGYPQGKTSILGLLLSGPLMGGLYLYFLKKIRRETAGVETAFSGFRQPFPHLVVGNFLAGLLTGLGFVCLILPGVYLLVAWILVIPLIVDRRLEFWPAMQLSRKLVTKHWWKYLGFLVVLGLINMAGLLACGFGLFITFPLTFAALAYAYDDIIGAVKSPAGASASTPAVAPFAAPMPKPDRFWRRFAVVVACRGFDSDRHCHLRPAGGHRHPEFRQGTAPVPAECRPTIDPGRLAIVAGPKNGRGGGKVPAGRPTRAGQGGRVERTGLGDFQFRKITGSRAGFSKGHLAGHQPAGRAERPRPDLFVARKIRSGRDVSAQGGAAGAGRLVRIDAALSARRKI